MAQFKNMKLRRLKDYFSRHGQMLMNLWLFVSFTAFCTNETYRTWLAGRLNFIEISFVLQNILMVFLFLVRRKHVMFNKNIFHQLVAITAFCSGAAFLGQPVTAGTTAGIAATVIIIAANILGMITMFNLGRSFGVLIALRQVKTGGLYSVIRHPMYMTDILLRAGYVVYHFTVFSAAAFVLSTACYVYRAMLEERFLSRDHVYREYMERVRFRFVPFLF